MLIRKLALQFPLLITLLLANTAFAAPLAPDAMVKSALTGPALMSVTQRSESRLFSSLSSNAPPSSQVRVAYSPVRYAA